MAVFLSNICKFNSCGLKFASLPDLIRHIEDHHVDIDSFENPTVKAGYLPVSCILRIFGNPSDDLNSIDGNTLPDAHVRKSINSPAASLSTTPTEGSELDEDGGFESDSGQSSIDSWANVDTTPNHLMKFHQILGSSVSPIELSQSNRLNGVKTETETKRMYICNITGCNKQYRTSNSLSHHRRSAHKLLGANIIKTYIKPIFDESNKKIYKCFCGKVYKTSHGLKSHINSHHPNNNPVNISQQADHHQRDTSAIPVKNEPIADSNLNTNHSSNIHLNSQTSQQFLQINPQITLKTERTPSKISGNCVNIKNGLLTNTEIITDNNCPPVSVNVEISSEPKTFLKSSPPIISAPTLQQHLLSPIIPKVAN